MQYPLPTGVIFFPSLKTQGSTLHWWCTPLISALGGQVRLYEFQDSRGYTEKSLSRKTKTESMKIQGLSLVVILLYEFVF